MIRILRPEVLFKASAAVCTLAAYTVVGLPLKVVGWLFLIGSLFLFRSHSIPRSIRRASHLVLALAVIFSLANIVNLNESWSMPGGATTGYSGFVFLRYFELFLFVLALYVSYRITRSKGADDLVRFYTKLGFIVALYALYVWVAQQHGWWEPPRTRMGTGGQDFLTQAVSFQYAFHRALGPFREPSHLAQWLILPLFLCLVHFDRRTYCSFAVMLGVLLLTGSMLGVGMLASGAGVLLVRKRKAFRKFRLRWLAMAFAVGTIAIYFSGFTLLDTVAERLGLFFEDGVFGTNRAYVWRYVYAEPPPILGFGLGNATIRFGVWRGSDLSASYLSAYLHYLYAGGLVALIMFLWLLIQPFTESRRIHKLTELWVVDLLLAVHGAWVFCYFFHAETLNLSHAAALGMFFAVIDKTRRGQTHPRIFYERSDAARLEAV